MPPFEFRFAHTFAEPTRIFFETFMMKIWQTSGFSISSILLQVLFHLIFWVFESFEILIYDRKSFNKLD